MMPQMGVDGGAQKEHGIVGGIGGEIEGGNGVE